MALDIQAIRSHQVSLIEKERVLYSSVCIPLIQTPKGYEILFEVRSSKLDSQPGDICFPGGRVEEGEDYHDAAIRELCEELEVDSINWEDLGPNDIYVTEYLRIHPYIGILHNYQYTYSKDEVAKVFSVPISFFEENEPEIYPVSYQIQLDENFPYERINGGRNYKWRSRKNVQYFYQYQDYCIWGLTAKILYNFIHNFTK